MYRSADLIDRISIRSAQPVFAARCDQIKNPNNYIWPNYVQLSNDSYWQTGVTRSELQQRCIGFLSYLARRHRLLKATPAEGYHRNVLIQRNPFATTSPGCRLRHTGIWPFPSLSEWRIHSSSPKPGAWLQLIIMFGIGRKETLFESIHRYNLYLSQLRIHVLKIESCPIYSVCLLIVMH